MNATCNRYAFLCLLGYHESTCVPSAPSASASVYRLRLRPSSPSRSARVRPTLSRPSFLPRHRTVRPVRPHPPTSAPCPLCVPSVASVDVRRRPSTSAPFACCAPSVHVLPYARPSSVQVRPRPPASVPSSGLVRPVRPVCPRPSTDCPRSYRLLACRSETIKNRGCLD